MKIFAVIPAYNESKVISGVVSEVKQKVDQVVVVDDGSTDQTGRLASQAGAMVITHLINRGQGAAIQTGIFFALDRGADIIVTFDADGQLLASEIDRVVEPLLLGGVEVVLGSRFVDPKVKNQIPKLKKIVLQLATWLTRLYTGLKITDTHNGFRALSRHCAELIEIHHDGMAHASEILEQIKKYNLRFMEVPVTIRYTTYSLNKGQKLSNSFKIFWDLFFSRLSR